jgi:hypothetical protein
MRRVGPGDCSRNLLYKPNQVVFYDLDPEQVITVLFEAGLAREEVWSLLSMAKTNLEKGMRKLRRRDLLELVLPISQAKVSEKIDFPKLAF